MHLKNAVMSISIVSYSVRGFLFLIHVHPEYIYVQCIINAVNYFKGSSTCGKILLNIFSLRNSSAFHNLRQQH